MTTLNVCLQLIFTAQSPTTGEIFCAPPPDLFVNDTLRWISVAHEERFSRVENEESYNYCSVYEDAAQKYLDPEEEHNLTDLVPCRRFEHRPTFYSLIHQYELFCSRRALVALTQTFHLLGVLVGGIITHFLLKM